VFLDQYFLQFRANRPWYATKKNLKSVPKMTQSDEIYYPTSSSSLIEAMLWFGGGKAKGEEKMSYFRINRPRFLRQDHNLFQRSPRRV
jgi:hypothetical protein